MAKALLIDITRCNGCYDCQLSCKDEHVGNDWSPIAKPQPNTGHFWWKITETVQGTVPKVRVHYMHHVCHHCENCPLVDKGVAYRREDGLVILDPEKAKGRRDILAECPYDAVYWNDTLQIAQKCTGCAHLLDDGWENPRCVESCHLDALIFGEYDDLKEKIEKEGFEQLRPDDGLGSRVWYKGLLNKFFIAGEVFDPVADECLEDAKVTLIDKDGKEVCSLQTDIFGDFWFERCVPGVYIVKIDKDGYETKTIEAIDATEKDINIGSIELNTK